MLQLSVSEKRRLLMIKLTIFTCFLSLVLNKVTIVILFTLINIDAQIFRPLLNASDLYIYTIFTTCTSFLGVITNTLAMYMSASAIYPHRRPGNIEGMKATHFLYIFYFFTLVATVMVGSNMFNNLEDAFAGGLFTSMKQYGGNLEMKQRFDKLQIHFKCCGDTSFKDWFKLQWIRHPYIDIDDAIERNELRSDGRYRTTSVPFSCCNPDILKTCIFEHVSDHGNRVNYNMEKDHTLHPQGCRSVLIWRIENLVGWTLTMYVAMVIINVFILVAFRYISTSIEEAINQGQTNANVMAYL